MNTRKIIFIVAIFCGLHHMYAQQRTSDFSFVNIKDGISKTAVSAIIQDHYGFIWLGTNGAGLHRYDGIEYISYKHELMDATSLSGSLIYSLFFDKKNRLWVGTENGLDLYDRELDQFKRINIAAKIEGFSGNNVSVSSITEDIDGNILIGTFERGLFKLSPETYGISHIPNIDNTNQAYGFVSINTLKVDQKGKVYAGTNIGLREYDPKTKTLGLSVFKTKGGFGSVYSSIQSLLIDAKNDVWAGSFSDGMYILKKNTDDLYEIKNLPFTSNRILSLVLNVDGSIICGTENDGLFHFTPEGEAIKNYKYDKANKNSIQSNSIWSLFMDKNDRIWMGYYNSGVALYDELYDKFYHIESLINNPNSLEVASVTGIVEDKLGRLWISTDGGGIDVYSPKTKTFNHINKSSSGGFPNLTGLDVQTVFIDSKENVWVGTWNEGLFLLKKGSKEFVNYNVKNTKGVFLSNSILSFSEDKNGVLWIGSFYGGVMSYEPDTDKFIHHNTEQFLRYGIHASDVRKVLTDSHNNIWVGSAKGLYKIVQNKNKELSIVSMREKMINRYKNETSANHVLSICESADGSIWIGTRGAGLCKYDTATDSFTWYNESSGLKEENISAIIEDKNKNIWVSGNLGIHKLDRENNDITSYNINDGLLSNDFNFNAALLDKNGNVYFGNYKGVDYFNPESIKTNNSLTYLYLTDFKLSNEKVYPNRKNSPLKKVISETDSISLSYQQSVFTIEYTGVNYTRPEKNQYAYYLEGLEDSWNYVGNARSATYTNLDQGNYTFKLKVANNDGVWNETPLHLNITILPPWWKTNWAVFSYMALFLMGIYFLNRLSQSRIKEKQMISYEREKRIKEEELHQSKLQFFTNISHEFRTPLTLIINPLEDIISNEAINLPEEVRQKHKIIHKNTDRLYRLINELMDYRKLEFNKISIKAREIDIVVFIQDIVSYFVEEALDKNIKLTVIHDIEELKAWVDIGMFEKIIFNLLSNAFKVTPEGGVITVRTSVKKKMVADTNFLFDKFEISVSDTGPGLKKEQLEKIFERFYQVDNLNQEYYGGTGIGLEVVRSFVELHKGNVEVDSVIDKGTTFSVVLPLGKAHFQENEMIQVNDIPSNFRKEKFITYSQKENKEKGLKKELQEEFQEEQKPQRLLIVEDNIELRNYLKKELSRQYKIYVARNGKEGLALAKSEIPDMIITDVVMPEMNGFEFCARIKRDIETSHIPLLMLTAKTMSDDRLKGIESGADIYMSKPFDMRVLKSRLSQLLSSRQLLFNKYFNAISTAEINENNTSIDKEFIQKVLNHIHENLGDPNLSVESLSEELHLSRSQFYRKIKTLTGQTANQFLRNIRLQKAKQVLESGATNVSEVCYKVGFSSPSYFTKCFKAHFGMLPTEVDANNS